MSAETPPRPVKGVDYDASQYWEHRYGGDLDLSVSGHSDFADSYNRWLYRRKQWVLRGALRRAGFETRGKRLLEIGAGLGAYLEFWRKQGVRELTGLDLSSSAAEFLRQKNPDFKFMQRDVTKPGLKADTGGDYDIVTAIDVLYHVVDNGLLGQALNNVRDVLRPNGLVTIHDQFLHGPSQHHGYLRWRSIADWTRLLNDAGFDIVSRTPIFFTMIQPTDWQGPFIKGVTDFVHRCADRWPSATGRMAFACDVALGSMLSEGPSMELVLARRRA